MHENRDSVLPLWWIRFLVMVRHAYRASERLELPAAADRSEEPTPLIIDGRESRYGENSAAPNGRIIRQSPAVVRCRCTAGGYRNLLENLVDSSRGGGYMPGSQVTRCSFEGSRIVVEYDRRTVERGEEKEEARKVGASATFVVARARNGLEISESLPLSSA